MTRTLLEGLRSRLLVVGLPLAFVYVLTLGGTPIGEQLGWLRIVNTVLGAAFVAVYVERAARAADRVDRLVLGALVLFAGASVTSAFPRQSLDALLVAMAYAAIFFVARDIVRNPSPLSLLLWTMRGVSGAVALFGATQYIPSFVEWWRLTEGTVLPPIGLPFVARPWGHAYDAMTLGLMLYPSWLAGRRSRMRVVGAVVVGVLLAVVVLLLGSRALWLAVMGASIFVGGPHLVRRIRRTRLAVQAAALAALIGIAAIAGILGGSILERLFAFATVGQRAKMWEAATATWLQRPLTGWGPGSFPWVLQETEYFDTNSLHPRHPDNALFQLLPELGLFGVFAAILIVVAVAVPLLGARARLPVWPIALFVVYGVGANPTDFSYLIVVALVWAAIALPRESASERNCSRELPLRWAHRGAMVLVSVPVAATLIAGLHFDRAATAVLDGDIVRAEEELDSAIALDPGMALYARQRGIARILLDKPQSSVRDLQSAAALNRNDEVNWRALSIALSELGDNSAAEAALAEAVALQRSDPTSLVLAAYRHAESGDRVALQELAPEIALAWPAILAAPGWSELISGALTPESIIDQALRRWQAGEPSPEPLRGQPLQLSLLGERADLIGAAAGVAGEPPVLATAATAVAWCNPMARSILESVPFEARRADLYWALRIQQAAEEGTSDAVAVRILALATFKTASPEVVEQWLNPLRDFNPRGSVDPWGYDRVVIAWSASPIHLPHPEAGAARMLLDPAGVRSDLALDVGFGSCADRSGN